MLKANSSMRVVFRVLPYLWPKDNSWVKKRVTISIVLLFLAKIISVFTPFLYKGAVDYLSGDVQSSGWMLGAGAISLTVAYGIAKFMHVGIQQLRDVVFARVGQRALRELAIVTFTHIHKLSMRYHISRKTGGLSRII